MQKMLLSALVVLAAVTAAGFDAAAQQQGDRGGGAPGGGGRGVFHDLDVALQGGTGDVLHWMAWNIPAAAGGIPEGKLPEGSVQGANITGQNVYFGPGAPNGPRYHHYVFELYALNAMLDLPATASRDDLIQGDGGKDDGESGVCRTISQRIGARQVVP